MKRDQDELTRLRSHSGVITKRPTVREMRQRDYSLGLALAIVAVRPTLTGPPDKRRARRATIHKALGDISRWSLIIGMLQFAWLTTLGPRPAGLFLILQGIFQLVLRTVRHGFTPFWDDLADGKGLPVPESYRLADNPRVPIAMVQAAAYAQAEQEVRAWWAAAYPSWEEDEPPQPEPEPVCGNGRHQYAKGSTRCACGHMNRASVTPGAPTTQRLAIPVRVLVDSTVPNLERWAYAHPGECLGDQRVHLFWTLQPHQACRCGAYSWDELAQGHWRERDEQAAAVVNELRPETLNVHTARGCATCAAAFQKLRADRLSSGAFRDIRREHRAAMDPEPEAQPNRRHSMMVGNREHDCERDGHLVTLGTGICVVCEQAT